MKRIRLDKIKIRKDFLETTPSENKMNECREYWRYNLKQDRPIIINYKGYLVDGYVMYCILKEHKEKYAMVRKLKKPTYRNKPTVYIFGTHPNSKDATTYMWRVPESWGNWVDNLHIGDTIFCYTKNGVSPVIVQDVEILSKPPINKPIKIICNKLIKRDGEFVKWEVNHD